MKSWGMLHCLYQRSGGGHFSSELLKPNQNILGRSVEACKKLAKLECKYKILNKKIKGIHLSSKFVEQFNPEGNN